MSQPNLSEALSYNLQSQTVTLTINRPDVSNAFDPQLIKDFIAAFDSIKKNDAICFVIIQGQGKHFSAGADLNWMKEMAGFSKAQNKQDAALLAQMMYDLYHLEKVTIAAVQGAAIGGGLGLVACCDLAIAEENATFCLSETKLGLSPAVISPYVCEAIGLRNARYAMLTAKRMTAEEALRLGLIHEITAEQNLQVSLEKLLTHLNKNGPNALLATKKLLLEIAEDKAKHQDTTSELIAHLRVSPEGQEGIKAFLEKRAPNWISS